MLMRGCASETFSTNKTCKKKGPALVISLQTLFFHLLIYRLRFFFADFTSQMLQFFCIESSVGSAFYLTFSHILTLKYFLVHIMLHRRVSELTCQIPTLGRTCRTLCAPIGAEQARRLTFCAFCAPINSIAQVWLHSQMKNSDKWAELLTSTRQILYVNVCE